MLLEREREIAAVREVVYAACRGRGQVLIVEGPAGIGKTELVELALGVARDAGVDAAHARATELERDIPLGVVRQLFERRMLEMPSAKRRLALRGPAAPAASAFGLSSRDRRPAEEQLADAVRHGLFWLAAHLCERGPLLICVDDLHWSDLASLRWVLYVAARIESHPIALVAAVRTPVERGHELVPALSLERAATGLSLAPLSRDGTAAMIRQVYGMAHPAFVRACHAASGGNPFLVSALLLALREEGLAPTEEGASAVGSRAPESVTRSVHVRLARLSASARALARAVAVLEEAPVARAAAMVGLSAIEGARAADELSTAGILRPGRPLAFTHPLLRSAVDSTLQAAERSEAPARAASLLERDGPAQKWWPRTFLRSSRPRMSGSCRR